MWSTLFWSASLLLLSSISQLDISGDKKLLRNSVPDSVQLLKQEFKPQLQANYADSDEFYERWLRSRDYNIARTRDSLKIFVNWRSTHVSSRGRRDPWEIENVPFDTLQDKQGESVLVYALANYNFRKIAEENQNADFIGSVMKTLDTNLQNIYSRQQAGQNISHVSIIVDWTGYNVNEHLCPRCVTIYLDFIKTYEATFPLTVRKIVHVKAPKIFNPVVTLMRTFMSDKLRETFIVYYGDQNVEAKAYLDSWIGKANNIL